MANLVRFGLIRARKKWGRSTSKWNWKDSHNLTAEGPRRFSCFWRSTWPVRTKKKKIKQRQNRVVMKKGRTELVGLKKVTERLESRPTLHDLQGKSKKAKFYVSDHPFEPARPAWARSPKCLWLQTPKSLRFFGRMFSASLRTTIVVSYDPDIFLVKEKASKTESSSYYFPIKNGHKQSVTTSH